jgi:hypothetical protein
MACVACRNLYDDLEQTLKRLCKLKMARGFSAKRMMEAHPVLLGAFIGLFIIIAIIVVATWFPRIDDAWMSHQSLVRSVWCTLALFVVCIYRLSAWRRRRGFWLILSAFFALHVVGVILYSIYVHQLLLQEWVIVLLGEAAVIVFLLGPLLQGLRSSNK